MALRRSSGSILKVGSSRRRSRGAGGSFDMTSTGTRLYDMEYRQMTEDYRDEIISFDEYIAFLKEKEAGLPEGEHDRFTISKRIKDITNAYNKKAESEYKSEVKLEEQKYAEDYRNGLMGFEAFYPYLQEKAEYFCGLDQGVPENESACFMATKKADDVMFQQNDREMDFMFKALKTVSPDDYISWKESQLDGLDPNSNAYMQIYKDIESAKKEKVSRGKTDLEYDILIGEADKADLLKWYDDAIKNTEDPDTQKKYFTQRCNLADSMNKELEAEYRKERALEEQEWALKFRRGDLGNTVEENIQNYYNLIAGRYEEEYDPSKQMTYMSKLDSLEKQAEDIAEGKYKKGVAAGKAAEKNLKDEIRNAVKEVTIEKNKLNKALNSGELTAPEYAQAMAELFRGDDGYIQELMKLDSDPRRSFDTAELIAKEWDTTIGKFETDAFWKANIPITDDEGRWTGEVYPNPNYKAVQGFNEAGNMVTKYIHDPDQSHEMEGAVWDKDAEVYRKYDLVDAKDEDGNVIKVKGEAVKTKEIYMLDSEGNTTKISLDEKTQEWMNERTGQAQTNFWDVDVSKMKQEELSAYLQKIGKERSERMIKNEFDSGQKGKMGEGLTGNVYDAMIGAMETSYAGWGKAAASNFLGTGAMADIGAGIEKTIRDPADTMREAISGAKEAVSRGGSEFIDKLNQDRTNLMNAGKDFLSGAKGKDIKEWQQGLADAGLLAKKFVTGYVGPATEKAKTLLADKVAGQITSPVRELEGSVSLLKRKGQEAISSAASKYFGGAQTAYAQNKIGGVLGDVYAKRSDLQQHFDASGKGISAAWKGHTIQEWAERHGKHEEASLKGYQKELPKQSQWKPKPFDFGKAKQQISSYAKPLTDFSKKLFSPIYSASQKAQSRITSDFSQKKFKRLGSDVSTIKKHTSSWLNKFKWW